MCTSHRVRSTSESCGARASTVCLSCFAVSLGHLLHVPTLLGIARCYLANHVLKMRALLGVSYCYLPDHMLHVRVLLVMLSFSISRAARAYTVNFSYVTCCHARVIRWLKPPPPPQIHPHVFELRAPKALIKGVFNRSCCFYGNTKMITKCQPMIGQFFRYHDCSNN